MSLIPCSSPYFTGYQLDRLLFTGNRFSVNLVAMDWKPDGSRFVTLDDTGSLSIYDCSTLGDVSTASGTGSISITYDGSPGSYNDLQFSDDGNKIFVGIRGGIQEFSLSSAYGGSATYLRKISGITGGPVTFRFTPDGEKLLICYDETFRDANLTTGFDLSTASAISAAKLDLGGNFQNLGGFDWGGRNNQSLLISEFKDTGGDNRLHNLALSTPENVSTASLEVGVLSTDPDTGSDSDKPTDVVYLNEGRSMYLCATNEILQYSAVG